DQETGRTLLNVQIDPAAARESDLLAFEKAIEIGHPASVMCSYNKVNGDWACENAPLLTGVLKQDWKYPGWVMSDWGAVHSTVKSALAGLDQESGRELDREVYFGAPLQAAVASGAVPKARYDDMAHRVVRSLYAVGVMDDPPGAVRPFDAEADAAVAQQAAENGITLLKNARDLLPVAKTARRIVVIGGHADFGVISGGGSSQVIPAGSLVLKGPPGSPSWGSGVVYLPSSPLAAIKARAPGAQVVFDDGSDPARAAALAKGADLAVVFATQWASEDFDIPMALDGNADALIAAVADANPRTAVVLETAGAVAMPWLPKVASVMEAWYPGARGGEVIGRALFGEIDTAGRLPVTFPASTAQLPNPELPGYAGRIAHPEIANDKLTPFTVTYPEGADVGYRWFERTGRTPLFAFGHGLSYTRFAYADLKVTGGVTLHATLKVTNAGSRPGVATPQVYAAGAGQQKRLVGWGRVRLAPGESRLVSVIADPRDLARFDTAAHHWSLAGGSYRVSAGAASDDAPLAGETTLRAQTLAP
ncbi:MAG: glycoside hydrolase family 3 protein, partial [Caulobacteraceae bacterium]|nr:glycoside hydrolase family 3 protein [Caulobacter sp.]